MTPLQAVISEILTLIGFLTPIIVWIKKIVDAQKCQLRSDMLRIYFGHQKEQILHQYEYENFMYYYKAYKALKGNSFIDKVHEEVKKWKVIS